MIIYDVMVPSSISTMASTSALTLALLLYCAPLTAFPVRRPSSALRSSSDDGFAAVEAEVQAYLRKRESALGEDDDCASPLDPSELQRFGYSRLVGKFMDYGGYIVVSRRLGVRVSPPGVNEELPDIRPKPAVNLPWELPEESSAGSLAMGQALEERLSQAGKLSTPEERAKMAMRLQQSAAERSTSELGGAPRRRKRRSALVLGPRDVWVSSGSSEDEEETALQPFTLSLLERFSVILGLACWALVHGRATSEAIELGLDPNVVDIARIIGRAMAAASVFGSVGCGVLAQKKNRSVPLWVTKGLMCGVAAVYEIRQAEELPEQEPELAGDS